MLKKLIGGPGLPVSERERKTDNVGPRVDDNNRKWRERARCGRKRRKRPWAWPKSMGERVGRRKKFGPHWFLDFQRISDLQILS